MPCGNFWMIPWSCQEEGPAGDLWREINRLPPVCLLLSSLHTPPTPVISPYPIKCCHLSLYSAVISHPITPYPTSTSHPLSWTRSRWVTLSTLQDLTLHTPSGYQSHLWASRPLSWTRNGKRFVAPMLLTLSAPMSVKNFAICQLTPNHSIHRPLCKRTRRWKIIWWSMSRDSLLVKYFAFYDTHNHLIPHNQRSKENLQKQGNCLGIVWLANWQSWQIDLILGCLK